MNLHLLIIEDEQSIIDSWREKLDFYGVEEKPAYTILPTFVTNLSQAKLLLANSTFDASIIDIRLESDDGIPNKDGNELFNMMTSSSLTVSAVYTGEPEIVELADHQKEFAKVFAKGDGNIELILQWLDDKSSMISAIQNMQKAMKSEMAKVFSKSIWPRWNYWINSEQNQAYTEVALTRHMATHLHASFLNEVTSVHPEEYYFIPPLQEQLDTGDIFLIGDYHYVLLTPRCDLARVQNPTFQLVKLNTIKEEWDELKLLAKNGENRKVRDKALKNINKLVSHGDRSPKLHFIPQIKMSNENILGPFHAEFNYMTCEVATEENRERLMRQRIATLSNEFVPSLVERLGSYFSRIGTPDYSHFE